MADGWQLLNNAANLGLAGAKAIGRAGAAVGNDILERGAERIQNARGIETAAQYRSWLDDIGVGEYRDWKGIKVIGQGGQGKAGIWVRLDSNSNIVDRVVMKETLTSNFDAPYIWDWPGRQYMFTRDAAVHAIVGPDEGLIAALQQLHYLKWHQPIHHHHTTPPLSRAPVPTEKRVGKGTGTVHLRKTAVDVRNKKIRMYMDYASHGDLFALLSRHVTYKKVPTRMADGAIEEIVHGPEPVPEQYCWFVMYHLMLACKSMAHADFGRKGEVIHQDIKFENVFLDAPDPDWFPNYPIPKLGDFGSARMTYPGDAGNPSDWRDPMTSGWVPPEYYSRSTAPLNQAANVWQCGLAILGLMQSTIPQFNPRYGDRPLMIRLAENYSRDLVGVVGRLLEPRPQDRMSPEHVLGWLDRNRDRVFGGVDEPETASLLTNMHVRLTSDDYRMGMRYNSGPEAVVVAPTGMSDSGMLVDHPDLMSGVVMGT